MLNLQLHLTKFFPILLNLQDKYKVLEIDGRRIFNYKTIYLDTHEYMMYLQHHNNKLNRYKIRIREYSDTSSKYLEIKFKTNTDRTVKDRIKLTKESGTEQSLIKTVILSFTKIVSLIAKKQSNLFIRKLPMRSQTWSQKSITGFQELLW